MTAPAAAIESDRRETERLDAVQVLYVQAPGLPRASLAARLRESGFETTMAADAADAIRLLGEHTFAACLIDFAAGRNALTTLRLIRARHVALPLAGVIDAASPTMAAEVVHAGLTDILTWPFDAADLAALVVDARDRAPSGSGSTRSNDLLVAFSLSMREALRQVQDLAATRQHVWLSGPEGSGRSLLASALHRASADAAGPFVQVDCAGQSPSALEAVLFGAVADAARPSATAEIVDERSAIARARGGTLVLTHLDEASPRVQTRLSTLLRDREVILGGAARPIDVNLRAVATAAPGGAASGADRHPDLSTRFAARVDVPPLRRRREDIPLIATDYLARLARERARSVRLSRAALELLGALPWPGNVPELEHVIDVIVAGTRRPVVQIEDVLAQVSLDGVPRVSGGHGLREAREQFERECIEAALARSQGRVGEAARALGIQRTNLYRKVRQLGISRTLLSSQR